MNTLKQYFYRLLTPAALLFSLVSCTAESLDTDATGNNGITDLLTELGRLTWIAPSQREDTTPLDSAEINTYRVYYGTTPGYYNKQVDISKITAESATLTAFAAGTYYFAVTTVDTDGRESKFSQEIEVTF